MRRLAGAAGRRAFSAKEDRTFSTELPLNGRGTEGVTKDVTCEASRKNVRIEMTALVEGTRIVADAIVSPVRFSFTCCTNR